MQPIVNDRVKVLQAAPVECIEDVSACPRLLKPGVHLVTVLHLKQEVWHWRRNPLIFRQVTQFGILVKIEETQCKQKNQIIKDTVGLCIYTCSDVPHLSVVSSQQSSLKRGSSV